jgi:hypothetical protein
MHKSAFILFSFFFLHKISVAQDTLPNISVTQISNKVLISWTNPYSSVANINIQRSYDSLKNFTTIGSVLNVRTKSNGFIDSKEFSPPQYYRLFISFEGGTYIFTQSHRPGLDTMKAVVAVVPKEVEQAPVQTWFVPSKYVYTGKENNVIISLPDADKKKYSIKFFEDDGTQLFELKRVSEPYLILDKVNFIHTGLFDFELYSDGVIIERHKFFIPKDGKSMPALDVNGYEVR